MNIGLDPIHLTLKTGLDFPSYKRIRLFRWQTVALFICSLYLEVFLYCHHLLASQYSDMEEEIIVKLLYSRKTINSCLLIFFALAEERSAKFSSR